MIKGAHVILYSSDADADRAFLRDVLGLPGVDAGGGWLLFRLPPAEVAVHPAETSGAAELYLVCDDVEATLADLTARGVPVTFFGEATKYPAGPAALALKTGAALLPATLWFEGAGWVVRIHEPVPHTDVATMTQHVARVFEQGIREHPEDWHMLQRLWLADLDPRPAA